MMKTKFIVEDINGVSIDVGRDCKHLRNNDILTNTRNGENILILGIENKQIRTVPDFCDNSSVSATDVAKEFNVSRETVIRWCRRGHIPAEKFKSKWLINIIMVLDEPLGTIVGDVLILTAPSRYESEGVRDGQ